MIYSVRGHLLFSIFLFLLRYELNLYHWDNIWLYPNSFFICFIRKADVSFIVCEEKVYHERNAFIQFRVPMFLISHSCCWDAGEAARRKTPYIECLQFKELLGWRNAVIIQLLKWENLNSFNEKKPFCKKN